MGKLLKPRGLKGELRAAIFNEHGSALKVGTEIWLKKEEEYFSRKIETIKMAGEKSCIRLSGCNTLEDAAKVQGSGFFLPRDEFDPIGLSIIEEEFGMSFFKLDLSGISIDGQILAEETTTNLGDNLPPSLLIDINEPVNLPAIDNSLICDNFLPDNQQDLLGLNLADDLNISGSLGSLFIWVNFLFKLLDGKNISTEQSDDALNKLKKIDSIIGVINSSVHLDEEIKKIIEDRDIARKEKDWAKSDELRDELFSRGIIVEDTSEGQIWKLK